MEGVKPIKRGLNISWRTDVTSRQEKYLVVYTRNDTEQSVNIETRDKVAKLRDLYPGAEYKIQVRKVLLSILIMILIIIDIECI